VALDLMGPGFGDAAATPPLYAMSGGDEQVVALFHQTATGRGSGTPVKLHFGLVSMSWKMDG